MEKELAREELFLLVWEKPSTEVAKVWALRRIDRLTGIP
jgi:hypothetical protein